MHVTENQQAAFDRMEGVNAIFIQLIKNNS